MENEYIGKMKQWAGSHRAFQARSVLVREYAWCVLGEDQLKAIEVHLDGHKTLSVGCGTGWNEKLLRDRGVEVVATDLYPPEEEENTQCEAQWVDVEKMDGVEAVKKYRDCTALFMAWPPYQCEWAAEAARSFEGEMLVFVGEGRWGCTANDEFFDVLDDEYDLIESMPAIQWSSVHDWVHIYRRKR